MNALHILILVGALAAGIYGTLQVKELMGSNKPNAVQQRYLDCIRSDRASSQCALDELMLRGLTCRS